MDSHGVVHDFQGDFTVAHGNMMCGPPSCFVLLSTLANTKYMSKLRDTATTFDNTQFTTAMDLSFKSKEWDEAVGGADEEFKKRRHRLLFDNCHSHVACALNAFAYKHTRWNMAKV